MTNLSSIYLNSVGLGSATDIIISTSKTTTYANVLVATAVRSIRVFGEAYRSSIVY